MAGPLALIDEFLTIGTRAYGSVLTAQASKEVAEKNAERAIKELQYKEAQERKAAALAAAETAKTLVSASAVKVAGIIAGLGIAGYVALNIFRRRRK